MAHYRVEVIPSWRGIGSRVCTDCKKRKQLVAPIEVIRGRVRSEHDSDFSWRMVSKRPGVFLVAPMGMCKSCKAKAAAENRERRRAELGEEAYRQARLDYQRRYLSKKVNRETARRHHREWW